MPLHLRFISLLAIIVILGSLFYYFYALTNGVILFMLAIAVALVIIKARNSAQEGGDSGVALARLYAASARLVPRPRSRGARTHTNESRAGGTSARATSNPLAGPPSVMLTLLLLAAAFTILFTHQTTAALRSPWEVIPPYFFLLYGTVVFLILTRWRSGAALFFLTFLTLSISLIIFPLGSGFDPFIHQATEKIIAATGTITPKPLYYIGQYTLVVFLSKITGLSVSLIDKLLVPLLAAFLLPWSISSWLMRLLRSARNDSTRRGDGERGAPSIPSRSDAPVGPMPLDGAASRQDHEPWAGPAMILAFLTIPFLLSPFTSTTPYSLALLFLVVLIFSAQYTVHSTQFLLASATLLIHPLVGIPAFTFIGFTYLQKIKNNLLLTAYCLLASIAIPLAFLAVSQLSSQIHITFAPQNFLSWLSSLEWSGIYRENRFNAPLDLLYFYGFNIKNIFWFFVFTAAVTSFGRNHKGKEVLDFARTRMASDSGVALARLYTAAASWVSDVTSDLRSCIRMSPALDGANARATSNPLTGPANKYLTTFLILLGSYIIMSGFLSFNFLIGYEQADYAKRVLDIAQLFLIPFFLLGIHWWLSRIPRAATVALLTLAIPASLFLTYPQKIDSYAVSHAFNTSQADIDAVRWIDADAHDEDYIVLANQAVSAAAIRELGFKKYYQSVVSSQLSVPIIFFYPIPTGSPLYRLYLNMVYQKASEDTLREAMQLVGVNRSYFVLNRYWADFDRILAEAKNNLRLLHSINNSIFIFSIN